MPANLDVRIGHPYGTLSQLNASTIVLRPGERWFRTDSPVITDPASPYNGKRNPATQWKTGDGIKTFSQLDWDPIGVGGTGGGGSPITLSPMSALVNAGDEPGSGGPVKLVPGEGDPADTVTLRGLLGAITLDALDPLEARIGEVTDDEAEAGGLRKLFNDFVGRETYPERDVVATFTAGSPTVQVSAPLPAEIAPFSRVVGPAAQVPNGGYAYVASVATDRMSFQLSSTQFTLGAPVVINAAGAGTNIAIKMHNPWQVAHGQFLWGSTGMNPGNGQGVFRSTPNVPSSAVSTSNDVEWRVHDGYFYLKSKRTPGGLYEQINGGVETIIPVQRVVAGVSPTAHHVWTSQPAADTEFLGNTRHRFRMWVPDSGYTQLEFWIDTLIVAGSTNAKLRLDFWNTTTGAWADSTTGARPNCALTGTLDEPKTSGWLTLSADLKAQALAGDGSVRCRIVGNSSNGVGSPAFGNVGYSLR